MLDKYLWKGEKLMDKFKTPEYLANTGLVYGPYGTVGYYNNNPIKKKTKKMKSKNPFMFFDYLFKKPKCSCNC